MEGGGGPPRHQGHQGQGQFFHQPRLPYYQIKPNYYNNHRRPHGHHRHQEHGPTNATTFDQKRMKNNLQRRTVDYNTSVIKYLQTRIWQRDYKDARMIQPDHSYIGNLSLPHQMLDNPINAVTTRFVRTSTNKVRCPIFCVVWTPEGRRLVTGASSGEFTLWNGLTFNFETILQAHECAVRTMTWSRNDMWLLTGDDQGFIKYWQSNMNNVQMYQAHKDQAVRCARYYNQIAAQSGGISGKLFSSNLKKEKYNVTCSSLRSFLCHLCFEDSCATCLFIPTIAMLLQTIWIYTVHCTSMGFTVLQVLLHYVSVDCTAHLKIERATRGNVTFVLNTIIILSAANKNSYKCFDYKEINFENCMRVMREKKW